MPANYAHYRFGAEMLQQMPGDIRRSVNRFRRLYDVGLHGPDLFYYYNPVISTRVGALGQKLHQQSGTDFFSRVCRGLRMDSSEAGTAYLYGLLTHYALDSVCQPILQSAASEGKLSPVALEAEFDRFLLEKDGKVPACIQDLSVHIQLTAGESATAAKFYSGINDSHIRTAVRNMALITKSFAIAPGIRRELVKKSTGVFARENVGVMIPEEALPGCEAVDQALMDGYEQAKALFPVLQMQISALMTYNAPLGQEFDKSFG